jgi:hypothetical protein
MNLNRPGLDFFFEMFAIRLMEAISMPEFIDQFFLFVFLELEIFYLTDQ